MPNSSLDEQISRLAAHINAGLVIPVIGNDLLKFRLGEDDNPTFVGLSNYLATQIADDMSIKGVESVDDLYHRLKSPSDLHFYIQQKLVWNFANNYDKIKFDSFEYLAKIKAFKVLFNASYTDFLEYHLRTYRSSLSTFNFYDPENPAIPEDITIGNNGFVEYDNITEPILYNLFGKYGTKQLQFIITEDDYIEFILRLKEYNKRLNNLKTLLEHDGLNILFIGCNFPNWLFRFFIRTFTDKKLIYLKNKKIMVSDSLVGKDTDRTIFFDKYQITSISGLSTEAFIEKLFYYLKQNHPESIGEDFTKNIIFLSYASEDFGVVNQIHKQLIEQNIDVWFDNSAIEGGDEFRKEIQEGINRACLFIPIISRNSQVGDKRRHYRLEWDYAIKAEEKGDLQIIPLVIDETIDGAFGIAENFWKKNGIRLGAEGNLASEFVQKIKGIQLGKRKRSLLSLKNA